MDNKSEEYKKNDEYKKVEEDLFIYKYQPIFLNDFELDEDMLTLLRTFIQINNLNVLFVGDIGTGKTCLLNAIIKEYYKGYNFKEYEDNILYINSLKEQGINYYRSDVKIFCQTCCSIKNRKKIVVLDDIDFINEQSQQVFRNCIDKFSHNVHFISSCSNIHKVIEGLQSRFLILSLKPLQRDKLYSIMQKIKINENIEIDNEAENFILDICKNSTKILITYMEKFKLLGELITFEIANKICTNISFLIFEEYTHLIKKRELTKAIKILYDIYDKGYSVMDILDSYFFFIKITPILDEDDKYKLIPIICKYINVFYNIHEDEIELSLFTNNAIQSLH